MADTAGYSNPAYARALSEIGTARQLPHSGGSILVRAVPGAPDLDATGPYPLFSCADWDALGDDLAELQDEVVSLVLVPDPFGRATASQLAAWFPDRCEPFKEHRVVDLARPPLQSASRHHRRDAARALRRSVVERVNEPDAFLEDWTSLYRALILRRQIRGPAAFSKTSLALQLRVPGVEVFRADRGGELLGAAIWYVDQGVAYYHLAAYTDAGYEIGVAYALIADALEHFASRDLEWASLGADAGISGEADSGLSRFKAGWSSETRTALICGRVFDARRYAELTRESADATSSYFPVYRAPAR